MGPTGVWGGDTEFFRGTPGPIYVGDPPLLSPVSVQFPVDVPRGQEGFPTVRERWVGGGYSDGELDRGNPPTGGSLAEVLRKGLVGVHGRGRGPRTSSDPTRRIRTLLRSGRTKRTRDMDGGGDTGDPLGGFVCTGQVLHVKESLVTQDRDGSTGGVGRRT